MKKSITIELQDNTLDILRSIGQKDESFELIIGKLLKEWHQK